MNPSSDILARFHRTLAGWFSRRFGEPTPVQHDAWASIAAGRHTLIAAPTGSGKTLAALLPCLSRLALAKERAAAQGESWSYGVRVLYITPLKALNNDIQHHLVEFFEAIEAYGAEESGGAWPGIRTAVRTGDTPPRERARMANRPPDVLVTTPESLYLLLTSEKGRHMLRTVETAIVDEIHSLAGDKRGAHLSISLERLADLSPHAVQRIGVSATQKPLTRVARFLGGWAPKADMDPHAGNSGTDADEGSENRHTAGIDACLGSAASALAERDAEAERGMRSDLAADAHPLGYLPRPVFIVESAMTKAIQVRVTMPDLSRPARSRDGVWQPIVERIMALMEGARSVLIFVNSRRLCERLVLRLNEHAGHEFARAHHGSLARERRLEVERMLKAGELRCLVATSSLELGIDVGHVDLVIQVDSPKAAAAGIQRIGRAGHAVGDVSRGYIVARQRGELPEAAVLCRSISRRDIEAIVLPHEPLDVLSQHLVAMTAASDMKVGALYGMILQSECYRAFPRARLEAALMVLSGFYPFARPLIDWDRDTDTLRKRANTAMAAVTGAGTIPSSSAYPVHHTDSRAHLGELDEEYIAESRVGDVFQLGTSSWMISRIENDRVYVQEAPNRFSEIPFWRAESGSRSVEVGVRLGDFLGQLSDRLELDRRSEADSERDRMLEDAAVAWLDEEYGLDSYSAAELIDLVRAQQRALGLPTARRIIIEHYRDLMNQTRIIIHNPLGRRVNRTWLLAIQRHFQRLLPYSMYGNAKDNGIELVVPDWDASWLQTLWQITADSAEPLLTEAIAGSPLLAVSFRRIAETSLLLSRSFTRTPMWQKRLRSEELLKQALPYAEHFPYLQEAMRECLHAQLDTDGLKALLGAIAAGDIEVTVKEVNAPSPFAVQFLADYANAMLYEGDGLSEATQLQLLSVSKSLAASLFGEDAVRRSVDPAIARAEEARLEAGQLVPASAEELFTLLKRRGDQSREELAAAAGRDADAWLEALEAAGRVSELAFGGGLRRWICAEERELYAAFPRSEASIAFVAGRFADNRLSFTEQDLRERYPQLTAADAERIADVLLALDRTEHAPFADEAERIWTSRGVAKRLIRLTLEQARKQAEAIDPVDWMTHMSRLQHVLSGTQLSGIEGLRLVIERLQGYFLPASHWETLVFPARVTGYRKEDLDLLCASGEIVWLGRKGESEKEGRIAFFLAEAKPLLAPILKQSAARTAESSKHPRLLELLRTGGASFLTKLSREYGKVPSELLVDLLDLVWEGEVSNDQFAPLRLQLATKGKQLARTGSGLGRWYWTGSLADEDNREAGYGPGGLAGAEMAGGAASTAPAGGRSGGGESGSRQGSGFGTGQPDGLGVEALRSVSSDLTESALHWTQHMLDSCGIVSKELVQQLSPFGWDELLPVLKQLEQWGAVTRGLLVEGVGTLQFARREGIEALRPLPPGPDGGAVTVLAATDPANPFGLAADWPAASGAGFARKSGSFLVLQHAEWRFWIENNGRHIVDLAKMRAQAGSPAADPPEDEGHKAGQLERERHREGLSDALREIFRTLLRQQKLNKIRIDRWNGVPVLESHAEELLRALGAERDNRSLVIWPSGLR
ncbi:DEAD/DEAH box helicase [Paenibacillus sacheonensis]|uniref:DEAD/DEAH box helicase n=1 Tax=Paenibacillus sacheonensis TaxID=742054 RepID=A0A7X4YRM7_9BACL|nr:DEAD/DEAH box helicase [Paenibacillus sacheonensis]MBM7567634.1 ATP-dependent Lhr-like helicase [Paenibacillus sacheonensis]NBC71263.1 DEAD/DEAH box helicase [Paenibacillus sacheonensis]